MRKIKRFMIGIFIILILGGVLMNRGCIMAQLTSEFRFEKYKTAEEAKAVLLKLHPVESPVDDLVKTLEDAGAECEKINKKLFANNSKYERVSEVIHCKKFTGIAETISWLVGIFLDDSLKIQDVRVSRTYEGV